MADTTDTLGLIHVHRVRVRERLRLASPRRWETFEAVLTLPVYADDDWHAVNGRLRRMHYLCHDLRHVDFDKSTGVVFREADKRRSLDLNALIARAAAYHQDR